MLNLVKTHFSKILPEYLRKRDFRVPDPVTNSKINNELDCICTKKNFLSELVEDETRRKLRSSQSNGVSSNDSETASTSSDDGIRFVVNVCDFTIFLVFFGKIFVKTGVTDLSGS